MRIAKPILLVTTPVGVLWGLYEAYHFAGKLAILMASMIGVLIVGLISVIRTIRREKR